MKASDVTNSRHYNWGGDNDGWHYLDDEQLSVIRERIRPGGAENLHWHRKSKQVFYVISGMAEMEVDGKTISLNADQSLQVPARVIHRIRNTGEGDLELLLISSPKAYGDRIEIIEHKAEYGYAIRELNREWLEKYFVMEPGDIVQLNDPEGEIVAKGGLIYYAREENEIIGTASLLPVDKGIYELGKMAVTESAQGKGIGAMLIRHCIHVARRMELQELILYSNRKLKPAIHLYEKFGFRETAMEAGHYDRADIRMSLHLTNIPDQ